MFAADASPAVKHHITAAQRDGGDGFREGKKT